MNVLHEIKNLLGNNWQQFDSYFSETLHSDIALLHSVNDYLQEHKGKQLRPVLTLLTAKIFGPCNQSALTAATAVELIHTATLLHDDVVDNADQRRGAASVKKRWRSNIAVLTGDYWLSKAFALIVHSHEQQQLLWLTACMQTMSEGELQQLEKTLSIDTSEEDYFAIIGKKTAALLATCMAIGADAAGADPHTAQYVYDTGYMMGIAFQIRDDIFDYERNSQAGKPAGNDIIEKKLTLPLLYALQHTDDTTRKSLLRHVARAAKSRRSLQKVIDFVHRQQGLEYAEKIMLQYSEKAVARLRTLPDSAEKEALITLAGFMTTRRK
jgi:octaprenyl-diphosphate synthase